MLSDYLSKCGEKTTFSGIFVDMLIEIIYNDMDYLSDSFCNLPVSNQLSRCVNKMADRLPCKY